ncbi:DUF881 domain-containing protein [Tissierella sp. MSJ-40]|uniref:DUF881 domain-containing protein n=1 Tax=Tissierella simiarum TaxID=2841534 RepID=A0ABS6E6L1_9FIRM|nr:DUF881 domain-containing protein [Tissierella simiarum]MBU5438171.1 DUF881 domain-containing protein [Tissierella simiarum]
MKSKNPKIILMLFSILIGVIMSTQMKLKVESYAPVTLRSIQVAKNEINMVNDEVTNMKEMIKVKEDELKMLENIAKGDDSIIDILSQELKSNKIKSGHTALEGPGIIIKMYDNAENQVIGMNINYDVIHDVDILNILNDLTVAGAEAISINGQRVLSISEIKCGGPIIKVNGKSLGTPFIIKAIGDPKLLNASINAPGTYGDTLKNVYQIGIESTLEDKILIPEYSGRFNFKYAKPLGEGD